MAVVHARCRNPPANKPIMQLNGGSGDSATVFVLASTCTYTRLVPLARVSHLGVSGCGRGGLMSKLEMAGGADGLRGALGQRVAVLVPCFNEETTIAKVIADFRAALPEATIYVYDNNSTDRTVEIAGAAGALVRREMRQGKGNVVRRMFADVDGDIYVLVDGDATYDAPSVSAMIARLLTDRLDMVVAARADRDSAAYRAGHRLGNWLFTAFIASIFAPTFTDLLSGYRVFSRRFVKSFPVLSSGFEIETELAV